VNPSHKPNLNLICSVGQFFDLMELFRLNGHPTDKHYYLFNGDFVDRGSWSTEIALLLYAYKWLRPGSFFINRGNHETDDMNRAYGFEGECKAKYNGRLLYTRYQNQITDYIKTVPSNCSLRASLLYHLQL
jgi:hypothetical protein